MKIDDVVLIKDENILRNDWLMGVIVNVELNFKGFVRSVVVRMEMIEFWGLVYKFVLLLVVEDWVDVEDSSNDVDKCLVWSRYWII